MLRSALLTLALLTFLPLAAADEVPATPEEAVAALPAPCQTSAARLTTPPAPDTASAGAWSRSVASYETTACPHGVTNANGIHSLGTLQGMVLAIPRNM